MAEVTDTVSDSSAAPLLRPRQAGGNGGDSVGRTNTLALLLNRAAGRRGASSLVRETAAMQLAERRADWGYSKPVVALDVAWNLGFTVVSVVMLVCTLNERPNVPIRVWICGYAFQCLVHVMLVWLEYRRRTITRMRSSEDGGRSSDSDGNDSEDESGDAVEYRSGSRSSFAKRCESINTIASFLWWIVGFYWIISGGEALAQNAPRLYWLAVVFLAFDVFFAIFCIALAFMIGVALCCCLPCIIAILYAVAGQEGATESDISMLARYRYEECGNDEKPSAGAGLMVPIGGEFAIERALLSEDAECCICLSSYEDGTELHALPCGHHFHATCIVRWLKINASCPLCKYNILKGNNDPV